MTDRLMSIYERVVLQRPLLVLLTILAVVGWLASHLPNLKLDASADSLVLEGDQALEYYREINKRYATEDFLLVTYQPDAPLMSQPVLDRLAQLRDELAALPGVSSVTSILDVPLLDSPRVSLSEVAAGDIPTLSNPDTDRTLALEEFTTSPLYRSLITSTDGTTTALQVNIERDERYVELLERREALKDQKSLTEAEQAKLELAEAEFKAYATEANDRLYQLVDKVRAILPAYRDNATVHLGGVPMIAADMIAYVQSDLETFGVGIVLFIIFLMAVIFRRLIWVVLPLATCVLSVLLMLGLLSWLDWRMTVISSNFVAILLIITLSITIHLVVRYREFAASNPSLDQHALVRSTVHRMAKPCLYTALTTIVAFASFVVSGIRPVIDFGWMMTIGVSVSLVLAFLVLPAGLMLLKRPVPTHAAESGEPLSVHAARLADHHRVPVIALSLLALALSLWGISRLEVENRFIDYFHEDTEIYQGMEVIDSKLGGTIPLEIIIDKPAETETAPAAAGDFADDFAFEDDFGDDFGGEQAQEPSYWFTVSGLERIQQVHDYLDSLPETGKVLSLATLYELVQMIMGDGVDDLQLALVKRSLPDGIKDILMDPYLSQDIGQARITVRVMETSKTLRRDELLKQVRQHLVGELGFAPEQVHLTGMLVLYNNMLQSLYRSQIVTLGAVFAAILVMFVFLFRSLWLSLIALAPNLLAAGAVLGGMGLIGLPLDMMTITIAAITVGIGVDDTIHYVHRFREEFKRDGNYVAAMYRSHGSIGKAMYYTSVIIVFGFSILALSNFNPSIFFGLLTGAAMVAALAGALLLLPLLIVLLKPLGPDQAGPAGD